MQVKKQHLEPDMEHTGSKSEKEYIKTVYCHPAYLNAEYIMRNAGLDEAQAGIRIAGRNINNLRYADDTTLMAENEEELKSLLMRVKEKSEKSTFRKLRPWCLVPSLYGKYMGKQWKQRLYFLGLQNHCRW